ncbi:MAG TPA: hypothetical protein IGQ44_04540 [Geminocystis sp. M7585_C2015_104]|nr:hypothetical protein [Geminocystis sp. M7585_C2015_104]
MGLVGFYDTSILTVILAALANGEPKLVTMHGRLKELDQVQGDPAKNVPEEVKQLSWFYRIVKKAQAQASKDPANQTVFPLYFPEVVASFNQDIPTSTQQRTAVRVLQIFLALPIAVGNQEKGFSLGPTRLLSVK